MALTGEAAIADTLLWHLSQIDPFNPPIPVAQPGLPFNAGGSPYLRPSFLPNRPPMQPIGFGDETGKQGLFQVSVNWPADKGLIQPLSVATAIMAHFVRGAVLRRGTGPIVRIIGEPWQAAPLQEPAWLQVPVSIPWVVYPV